MIQTNYYAYSNSERMGNVGSVLSEGEGELVSFADVLSQRATENTGVSEKSFTKDAPVKEQDLSVLEEFRRRKEAFIEEHKLKPEEIKAEEDWREMSEESWDKLMEHIDKFIEDYRERQENMKKLREEAARKMAAAAPAELRSLAVAQAELRVAANGFIGQETPADPEELEKTSWTYELDTEDQVVLFEAKKANEQAVELHAKAQELAISKETPQRTDLATPVEEKQKKAKEYDEK